AGADPSWKNRKPGALYVELPGTDPDDWSLPARTYKPDRDGVVAELVTYLASIGETPTTNPPTPADPAAAARIPAEVNAATAAPARGGTDDGDDDDPDADSDAECAPPPVDPDCPPDEDPHQPITVPNRPRIPLDLGPEGGRQYTPTEIRTMIRQSIIATYGTGHRWVRPSSFSPIVGIVG